MPHDKIQQTFATQSKSAKTGTTQELSFFPKPRSPSIDYTEGLTVKDNILIALDGKNIPHVEARLVTNAYGSYDLALTIRDTNQMALFKSSIYTEELRYLNPNYTHTLLFNRTETNELFDKLQIPKFNDPNSTLSISTWDILVFQHKLFGLILTLQKEIDSFWPYPNKERKQQKIKALTELNKLVTTTKTFEEAVSTFKTNNTSNFQMIIKGNRVKALLTDIAPKIMRPIPENSRQTHMI